MGQGVRVKIWTRWGTCGWRLVTADDVGEETLVGGCPEPWSIEQASRRASEEFAQRLGEQLRMPPTSCLG